MRRINSDFQTLHISEEGQKLSNRDYSVMWRWMILPAMYWRTVWMTNRPLTVQDWW